MKQNYLIWIEHAAFGVEGKRVECCTYLAALRLANKMARGGGHGWRGCVTELPED